jgi:hypothetical protein
MEQSLLTHSLVARGVVILSEYSSTSADHSFITAPILEHLATHPPDSRPRILIYGRQRIHILPQDGLVFLAAAYESVGALLVNEMLGQIAERFMEEYGQGFDMPNICLPYAMNEFSKTLALLVV